MKNDTLSIFDYYIHGKKRDTKTERQHLRKLAKKITKVPTSINIPSEYLTTK